MSAFCSVRWWNASTCANADSHESVTEMAFPPTQRSACDDMHHAKNPLLSRCLITKWWHKSKIMALCAYANGGFYETVESKQQHYWEWCQWCLERAISCMFHDSKLGDTQENGSASVRRPSSLELLQGSMELWIRLCVGWIRRLEVTALRSSERLCFVTQGVQLVDCCKRWRRLQHDSVGLIM